MALAVIGAGLGRTATFSLKFALEHLGFGPCYHMSEVFAGAPVDRIEPQRHIAARPGEDLGHVVARPEAEVLEGELERKGCGAAKPRADDGECHANIPPVGARLPHPRGARSRNLASESSAPHHQISSLPKRKGLNMMWGTRFVPR